VILLVIMILKTKKWCHMHNLGWWRLLHDGIVDWRLGSGCWT
jgi:hypothetical protein